MGRESANEYVLYFRVCTTKLYPLRLKRRLLASVGLNQIKYLRSCAGIFANAENIFVSWVCVCFLGMDLFTARQQDHSEGFGLE